MPIELLAHRVVHAFPVDTKTKMHLRNVNCARLDSINQMEVQRAVSFARRVILLNRTIVRPVRHVSRESFTLFLLVCLF
jgi:hypothetical protein